MTTGDADNRCGGGELDSRAKLLACAVFLASVALAPEHDPLRLVALAIVLMPAWSAARRMIGSQFAVTTLPTASTVALVVATSIAPAQLRAWLYPWTRLALCAAGVNLYARLTPLPEFAGTLRALGAPRLWSSLLLLAHRYFEVLLAEGARMAQSCSFRTPARGWRVSRAYGYLAAALCVRAVERSERIGLTLACRGCNGELPVRPLAVARFQNVWPCLVWSAVAAAATWVRI